MNEFLFNWILILQFLIFLILSQLFQGSYILRHEKGEAYAVVYKSVETAENYSLTSSKLTEIDRETISFVPLVWKGLQAQIRNTFPFRTEQTRGPPQKKSKKKVIINYNTFNYVKLCYNLIPILVQRTKRKIKIKVKIKIEIKIKEK